MTKSIQMADDKGILKVEVGKRVKCFGGKASQEMTSLLAGVHRGLFAQGSRSEAADFSNSLIRHAQSPRTGRASCESLGLSSILGTLASRWLAVL